MEAIERIVWIDLELTGLNIETDQILEVACIITSGQLNICTEGLHYIIHQTEDVLSSMDEFCTVTHKKSGLTDACLSSRTSLKEAERGLLEFLKKWVPEGVCPLGGNSVYMDRIFIQKHFSEVSKYLHYRIIDVSTVKELCRRWYPHLKAPRKLMRHRALEDIKNGLKMTPCSQNRS